MATGWQCSCHGRNFKTPYFPAPYYSPNLSHEVELRKCQNDDITDQRIGSGEKFMGKNEEKSDESQATILQPSEIQPSTGRRHRATYKRWQLDILEDAFEANCYPSTMFKRFLAARLDMENVQVQVWFQNRRARMKKDGSERTSPYGRSYPPTRRYYGSIMTRESPYFSHVVSPVFSGSDHVLRHDHPGYTPCGASHASRDVMLFSGY